MTRVREGFGAKAAWPLIIILVVGLALRLLGLRYGLPYVYNPDEVAIMSRALAFAKGDLNPHNFLYPTFYFYVLFAWEGVTALVAVAIRTVSSFGAFQREFFFDPTRVYVAGRLLTALLGTATVAATWEWMRRLAGPVAALTAALVVAIAPLHVRDSHYVKHDVPVTLLIVLAYLTYERLWNPPHDEASNGIRPLVAAGVVTGAAFSTHYYTVFLALPLAWAASHGARTRAGAVRRILLAGAISAVVFFALSPFILAEPATAVRDIHANRQIVVDRAVGSLGYAATSAEYARMLFLDTVGWPFVLLAVFGIVRSERSVTLRLLAFVVPFGLFIASTFPASRYLVPLVPFVAAFAGIAIARIAEWNRAVGWVAVAASSVLPLRASIVTDLFIRQTDTRTLAARYIESNVPAGSTVLLQPYSVVLEPTAAVLREAVARTGREMPTKTRLQLARTPYPSPAYRVIYLGRGLDADKVYLSYDELGAGDELSRLRSEHVAFVVLKRYNSDDPATLALIAALNREGRRLAVFSPYRDDAGSGHSSRPEPFLHNTDARIDAALERPGPIVEIWQIDGPRS